MEETPGRLTLVATPIGNLGDLSPRVIETLTAADAWLVEDSRISGKLAMHLGLRKPMWVLNDHTTEDKVARYAQEIASGQHVALLTDGGAPAVSDPGAHLADLCHDGGVIVDAIPGPSAPTLAITLSGFYAQRYAFLGFLPRKPGPMKKEFEPFRDSAYTLVAFESQFRIADLLTAAAEVLGDRRYAVCREMTKAFQQVFRSRLPYIPTEAEVPRKGEFTIVLEGKRRSDAD